MSIANNRLGAAGIPAVLLALLISPAATASEAGESADDEGYIEEIIVTASKREVNLQDSSLAITALTGDQLDSRGIREVTDIAAAIPGVDLGENTATESIIIVRGLSNNGRGYHRAEIWRQQTNTSYLDDIVLFPGITPLKLVDLERVEIVKGPQGTLFGKSAMAGAARYISNRPDPEAFSANVTGAVESVANGGTGNSLEGFVNVPLADALTARLTFYSYNNAGFIDSVGTKPKEDANTEDTDGLRLQVLWNMTENMSLHGYYIQQDTEVGDVGRPQSTWAVSSVDNIHDVRINRMDLDDPKRQFLEPGDTHEKVVSLKWQWDLEPFTLSVIGANMDNHSFFERNVLWECLPDDWCPGVPVGGLSPRGLRADFHVTEGPSERDIETMEVRAVSSGDGDEFIDWVAGFWYENANHRRGGFIWWDTEDAELIRELQAAGHWTGGCPEVDVAGGEIFHQSYTINNQDEKSAYGEVGFNFTDQFKFTVGYRRSRLSTNFTSSGDLGPCWVGDGPGSRASPWQDVNTYRFNVDYHVSNDIMLFAFAANGYRPGGTNLIEYNTVDGDRNTRVQEFTPYESDAVWNYEAGVRSAWHEGRLVLNGSIYRIDWAEMQSPTFSDYAATQGRYQQSGRSLINIGESEVIGIEAMGIYAVNDNLELTLHFGWKDSEILEDQRRNYIGLPLPGSTSGVQYSILGDWTQDTQLGELRANVTFRSVPERWGHFTKDNPNDPYTMTDASVSLRRGALGVSLFLDNVFDDRAIVWQTPNYPGWPSRPDITDWRDQFVGYYSVLRPRTLALSVSVDM